LLREADVSCAVNLEPAEGAEIDGVGVKAIDAAAGLDAEDETVTGHGSWVIGKEQGAEHLHL
jgi:hypothetical protein